MKARWLSLLVVSPALLGTANVALGEDDAFYSALKGGTPKLDVRLRYEDVDIDIDVADNTDEAQALTIRTRLGYQTGKLAGFDAYGEFEDTHVVLGVDDYSFRDPSYATIADPTFTELNQAWVRYTGEDSLSGLTATFGRQRIIYDNARFVGNVGWRQNEQTYDGTKLDYAVSDFVFSGSYITKVNTFTGGESFVKNVLLNAGWKKAPGGTLSVYSYMFEDQSGDDTLDTTGIRYSGKFPVGDLSLLVTAEYADQSDDPAAGPDHDADYTLAEVGVVVSGVTLMISQEVLGSDEGTYGFDTPLATKHAFNGWADQFLGTPVSGLEDTYVTVAGKVAGVSLKAIYHDFAEDEVATGSPDDLGTELDLVAVKAFGPYKVGLKYASFDAEKNSGKSDTDKVWAWTEFSF